MKNLSNIDPLESSSEPAVGPRPVGRSGTVAMILLLTITAPITLLVTLGCLPWMIFSRVRGKRNGKTVLLTGGKMSKSLQLARSFSAAGYRVILTEIEKYRGTGHRFSRSVDRFVSLPDPKSNAGNYVGKLDTIADSNQVTHFVPVSSPDGAQPDAAFGERASTTLDVMHYSESLTATLDDKFSFCELAASLGLSAPEVHRITTPEQLLSFEFPQDKTYLLKSVHYDSVHRLAMPRLPDPDLPTKIAGLEISEERPWVMQEFVRGNEYCTHTVARNGEVVLHGCSASSPFQVNYKNVEHPAIKEWVTRFVRELNLTGQVSFDFLVGEDGIPMPVECNPRTHTAVTMWHDHPELAAAYLKEERGSDEVIEPFAQSRPTYWLAHEVWRLLKAPSAKVRRERWRVICEGTEGVFRKEDPLPFFFLHHWQIPSLLLGNLLRGKGWLRIDFNIGKLVEPDGD